MFVLNKKYRIVNKNYPCFLYDVDPRYILMSKSITQSRRKQKLE